MNRLPGIVSDGTPLARLVARSAHLQTTVGRLFAGVNFRVDCLSRKRDLKYGIAFEFRVLSGEQNLLGFCALAFLYPAQCGPNLP